MSASHAKRRAPAHVAERRHRGNETPEGCDPLGVR
jgi:hypothetical protein